MRLGEWDAQNANEPFATVEINVVEIINHPQFNPKNLHYDIVILRMASNAPLGVNPAVTSVCLPSAPLPAGIRCWVSGEEKSP